MESLVMKRLALQPAAAAIFAQYMPACTHVFVGVVAPLFKFIVRDGVARRPSPWYPLSQVNASFLPRFARNLAFNLCLSETRGAPSPSNRNLKR
jgi:hypothetical protein